MLCPRGRYGDFRIEVSAEIPAKFPDIDEFSLDFSTMRESAIADTVRNAIDTPTGIPLSRNPVFIGW